MRYLLIDNCSLRDLIDTFGYSKYLGDLNELISSNKITFVTHSIIIEEWDKYKAKWQKDKEKKLLPSFNKHSQINIENTSLLPSNSFTNVGHIPIQISDIDKLLDNAKIVLNTPEIINNEFAERYKKKLAPFHNKKESQNDWEIFGSFAQYCESYGIHELYYLSANTQEFSANKDEKRTIHPDLKERFNKVTIHYYYDYVELLNELKSQNGISLELLYYTITPNSKYSFKTTIRANVLDSLAYLFNDLYSEIDFIPTHLLKKFYPFASAENEHTHYYNFTISNVSEKLIDFFENIEIKNEEIKFKNESLLSGIKDYKEKTEYVVQRLNSNLVFHLTGGKNRKKVCTHKYIANSCECFRCSFNRFKFSQSLKDVIPHCTDIKEKLKQAYIHYKFGNYHSANKIYDEIISIAPKEKKLISYFIAKYNQRHLANFLSNLFGNETFDNNLITRLKMIDPLEEAYKLKAHSDYNLLQHIATGDFFTDAFQKIGELVEQIRITYESQLNGGSANNQYIQELSEEFANLETFLNNNFIIYDCFSNFLKLFELVTEGLFASHAISKNHQTRFEKFDDFWVSKLFLYGDYEVIKKLFYRYHLKTLEYETTNKAGDSFIELFHNLIESNKNLEQEIIVDADKGNLYFERKFETFLLNGITIGSILNLTPIQLNRFSSILFSYFKSRNHLNHSIIEAIEFFFKIKGNLLKPKIKSDFLKLILNSNRGCHNNLLLTIVQKLSKSDIKKISAKLFKLCISNSIDCCKICNSKHDLHIIGFIFEKSDLKQKAYITNEVEKKLNKIFDFELFYISSIFEIIKPNISEINSLVSKYKNEGNRNSISSIFGGVYKFRNYYIDKIINLCFKFNIDTTSNKFKKIASIHPYYKWVLNMEKFNYRNFNPEWVLINQTTHFLKAMSKSNALKSALKKYIGKNFHHGIEVLIIKINLFVD